MDESVVFFLSVVSVKSASGCFIVQGGILSIELDCIFRTFILAEFRVRSNSDTERWDSIGFILKNSEIIRPKKNSIISWITAIRF